MTSVLHLDDVSLHRGSHQILSHVNWTVDEGQHWVLLGSNGAGKTTIARIASARLFPSSGTVDILSERLGVPGHRGAGVLRNQQHPAGCPLQHDALLDVGQEPPGTGATGR